MKWSHNPSASGIHRFACLSLYRALWRQSSKLPLAVTESQSIRRLVRTKFDRYKRICSPTQTIHSLQAGYEALDLFYSASRGNKDSLARINQYLEKLEARRLANDLNRQRSSKDTNAAKLGRIQRKRAENIEFQRRTRFTHPEAEPILSRPRPVVAGRRRVPVFVSARGVPFLRIKKPQPQILSRIIRQKLAHRDKLTARRHKLYTDLYFAQDEEDWDRYLEGRDPTLRTDYTKQPNWLYGTWVQSVWNSWRKSVDDIRQNEQKHQDLAEAMWKVVLAEKELAEKEEAQRKEQNGNPSLESTPSNPQVPN